MLCNFQPTNQTGVYRCRRCDFTLPVASPHAPQGVRRRCDVIDLRGVSLPRMRRSAKVWNASQAVAEFVARPGFVSPEAYRARLAICQPCEHRDGNTCALCGCRLALKARMRAWHCPIAKWQGDAAPNPRALDLARARNQQMRRMLIRFPHGFGDAVQLTSVLSHLRRLHSGWHFDVACKRGADSLFHGLASRTFVTDVPGSPRPERQKYTVDHTPPWLEPAQCYADSPGTKAERCLRETFGLEPIEELCRYSIQTTDADRRRAATFLNELPCEEHDGGRFPVVLIHYQGNSARAAKNLDHATMRPVLNVVRDRGFVPVILDWEKPLRSPLIDQKKVFCPNRDHPIWRGLKTGDGATLAALVEQSALVIGIDSGPEHVAAATTTPTIVVWRRLHPYHYFGLAKNVLHLVPRQHVTFLRGQRDKGLAYFENNYRYAVYAKNLRRSLPDVVRHALTEICSSE